MLNAADPHLVHLQLPDSDVRWFNHPDGWHLRGDVVYRGEQAIFDTADVPLPGEHNRRNLCAVLAAIEALGLDAAALAAAALTFRPLPNRLQLLGSVDGISYVNDSISTTPHASLAALACFAQRRVALLVGGHDRGLNWHEFAEQMAHHAPLEIVTMGANGPRIHALLAPLAEAGRFGLHAANDLEHAMQLARDALGEQGGVVLLSPGRPASARIAITSRAAGTSRSWRGSTRPRSVRFLDWACSRFNRHRSGADQRITTLAPAAVSSIPRHSGECVGAVCL